jgi:hypothetical protein
VTEAAPNTKRVSVAHPVPREPDAYRATVHFGQRLRGRVPEAQRDSVVRECIEQGELRGTTPPADSDADDVRQYFAFEHCVNGRDWRLVVGIRPAAFRADGSDHHLAVTIMEVDDA